MFFAEILVWSIIVYLGLGVLLCIPLLLKGLPRFDGVTKTSSAGFKIIVLPGLILLWPVVLGWSLRGRSHSYKTAHDRDST